MSKTMKQKLNVRRIDPQRIQKVFGWLGLEVKLDTQFNLYGRKGKASIVIPSEVVEALGLNKLRFSDAIGIDIKEDGSVEMIYDHYNETQAIFIEKYLSGLDSLGGNRYVAEKIAKGASPELVTNDENIQIVLNVPEFDSGSNDVWSNTNDKGGTW